MLGVLETQFVGNFADGFTGVEHLFFRYIHELHLDMLLCRPACFFFDQVAEIVGRQMQSVGTIPHGQ